MSELFDKVVHYLTGYKSIEAVAVEDLQKQVEEHPYFAVSQFLLAKKLQADNTPDALNQIQKAALYFPNPYWLQYQMMSDSDFELAEKKPAILKGHSLEKGVLTASGLPSAEETAGSIPELHGKEEDTASKHSVQVLPELNNHANGQNGTAVNNSDNEPEDKEADEHERMFQNIKAMLDATSEEADADNQSTVVPIDPYYTIDYFASQGIKLDLDRPQDHLGKQVKKFTQWLKHMKKLGPEDATEAIYRTEAETDIQQIAATSNIAREVVTEAMAMVLEKQGKKDKAVELYNKLTFLNPHKSPYFADQIKKLKST